MREKKKGEAAQQRKMKEIADQQSFEGALSIETLRTRQKEYDKQETQRIEIVISKVRFLLCYVYIPTDTFRYRRAYNDRSISFQ